MADAPFALRFSADGVTVIQAQVTVTPEALVFEPVDPPGERFVLDHADIETVNIGEWDLDVTTVNGLVLHISHIAERFDPFVASFVAARNERWVRGLLYRDQQVDRRFSGEVQRSADANRDRAEIRLYAASFVALCATADPLSVAYHDIKSIAFDAGAYAIRIQRDEDTISLFKLGDRFDEFIARVDVLRQELLERVAGQLRELVPTLTETDALLLAHVAGHGRAFSRAEAEAAAPGNWAALRHAVVPDEERKETLAHIAGGAGEDSLLLGIMTDAGRADDSPTPTRDAEDPSQGAATAPAQAGLPYTAWFLVARPEAKKVVLEVTSEPGHATYVFRVSDDTEHDARAISRALVALNFAREPIYLPLDKLETGVRRRYQLALRKLPYLGALREQFVGRAIHDDRWAAQLSELLARD